jgi:hypothetical protein
MESSASCEHTAATNAAFTGLVDGLKAQFS